MRPLPTLPHPAAQNWLVRSVNWLGDAVMTTPALLALRETYPQHQITLLTPQKFADLWQHHPAINTVIPFSPDDTLWRVARRLRTKNFTAALIFPNSLRSALETWLAGIPLRLGYARQGRNFFLTHPAPPRPAHAKMQKRSHREIYRLIQSHTPQPTYTPPPQAHHTFEYLHLVSLLGAIPKPRPPTLTILQTELDTFQHRLGRSPTPAAPWIGLNPGAEYGPAKRWPEHRFIETAVALRKRFPCLFLVFGGKADVAAAHRITHAIHSALATPSEPDPVINLAGATSLRELLAGLASCQVVLTNDTGPMHLAAALGTPVVVPFGSTSPELTGPGLPGETRHLFLRSNAPCSPCFLRHCPIDFRCMTAIETSAVVNALLSKLQ